MGSLVKQVLAKAKGWDPAAIYHVTVMPCYDKKLEASRDDFVVPGGCATCMLSKWRVVLVQKSGWVCWREAGGQEG
jgi:hypothetical protein